MDMSWLGWMAQLTIVLGFCGAGFNYIVIRPLKESIQRLSTMIAEWRGESKANNERVNRIEGEVRELHHAVQKSHDRIDELLRKEAHKI